MSYDARTEQQVFRCIRVAWGTFPHMISSGQTDSFLNDVSLLGDLQRFWQELVERLGWDELQTAVAAIVGDPLGKDRQFHRRAMAVRTCVTHGDVAKSKRAEKMFVVQPNSALATDDLHRLGNKLVSLAAVCVFLVWPVDVNGVENHALEMGISHATEVAMASQATGVSKTLPQGGHAIVVLWIVGERVRQGIFEFLSTLAIRQLQNLQR